MIIVVFIIHFIIFNRGNDISEASVLLNRYVKKSVILTFLITTFPNQFLIKVFLVFKVQYAHFTFPTLPIPWMLALLEAACLQGQTLARETWARNSFPPFLS